MDDCGLDFSSVALAHARRLAERTGTDVDFHEAEVYDAEDILGPEPFDLVYTGVGALCWLLGVVRWTRVVADLLRPGGRLFIREGHPMLWSLDDKSDALTPRYSYFEHTEPVVLDEPGTYVDIEVVFTPGLTHTWNHGLGEIVTELLDAEMRLTQLIEHDSVPWEALPGHMVVDDTGEWRLSTEPEWLAASYTM